MSRSSLVIGGAARRVCSRAATALLLVAMVKPVTGQQFRMPSSLRYGSGLLDVPVASVLPHLSIVGTYSGFGVSVDRIIVLDRRGREAYRGNGFEKWMSDGAIAIGLFDRVEVGTTIQHFDTEEHGGNMLGGFARASILPASVERLDLAVGARYVTSPSYGDTYYLDGVQPGRLGHPDYRLVGDFTAYEEYNGNLSPYVVATANAGRPEDLGVTLTAGWGAGMFSEGSDRESYADAASGGLFGGAALHRSLGGSRMLHAMAEFNGFDVNAGVQIDVGGIRVGAFALGVLYDDHSTYRSRKFGILGSLALCGVKLNLCSGETEPPPPPPPPPPPSGPNPEELEKRRLDSIARAQAEEEQRLAAERERAARELAQRAAEERRTLEEKIFFDYDQFSIREDATAALRGKIEILLARPGVHLRIEAHADERGSPEYNLELGQNRGDAVVAFFVDAGLDADRFTVKSFGEQNPLVQGETEVAWAQNRRVEFVITAGEGDLGR